MGFSINGRRYGSFSPDVVSCVSGRVQCEWLKLHASKDERQVVNPIQGFDKEHHLLVAGGFPDGEDKGETCPLAEIQVNV